VCSENAETQQAEVRVRNEETQKKRKYSREAEKESAV